ncbi:MAG: ThuA domain-containing protein [bacterium]
MRADRIAFALPILALAVGAALSAPASAQTKEIAIVAGPQDHSAPGSHEYIKVSKILAHCLENSTNVKGIKVRLFLDRVPKDLSLLKGVSLVALISSSDRAPNEQHALFPQHNVAEANGGRYDKETTAYLKEFDGLIKSGVGFAAFHYGLWVETHSARTNYLDWMGGVWVQSASRNPMGLWKIEFANPDHPILRGVKPWQFKEELFYRPYLSYEENRTDLLIAHPIDIMKVTWWGAKPTGPGVAAWAFQRDDGGRGFAYGGLHATATLLDENVRKFVLNGLVWAAGMDVPPEGVESVLTKEMMDKFDASKN